MMPGVPRRPWGPRRPQTSPDAPVAPDDPRQPQTAPDSPRQPRAVWGCLGSSGDAAATPDIPRQPWAVIFSCSRIGASGQIHQDQCNPHGHGLASKAIAPSGWKTVASDRRIHPLEPHISQHSAYMHRAERWSPPATLRDDSARLCRFGWRVLSIPMAHASCMLCKGLLSFKSILLFGRL